MWVLKNVELTLIILTTTSKHYVSVLNQSNAGFGWKIPLLLNLIFHPTLSCMP